MAKIDRCYVEFCKYNQDGMCGKEYVSVAVKTTGEFHAGERVSYPVCGDYEDAGNDGNG